MATPTRPHRKLRGSPEVVAKKSLTAYAHFDPIITSPCHLHLRVATKATVVMKALASKVVLQKSEIWFVENWKIGTLALLYVLYDGA